jgi:hypothetical protein
LPFQQPTIKNKASHDQSPTSKSFHQSTSDALCSSITTCVVCRVSTTEHPPPTTSTSDESKVQSERTHTHTHTHTHNHTELTFLRADRNRNVRRYCTKGIARTPSLHDENFDSMVIRNNKSHSIVAMSQHNIDTGMSADC